MELFSFHVLRLLSYDCKISTTTWKESQNRKTRMFEFFLITISAPFSPFLSFYKNFFVHVGICSLRSLMRLITGSINDTRSTDLLIRIDLYLYIPISHPRLFILMPISSPLQFLMAISSHVRARIYHSI